MIAPVLAFLATTVGRWFGIGAIVLGAWFAFAHHYEKQGASRVVAQIEERSNDNARKADSARRAVSKVPVDQLNDGYRRD